MSEGAAAGAEAGESHGESLGESRLSNSLSQQSSEAEHEQEEVPPYHLELPAARHGPTEAYHMVFGGGQDAGGSAHGSSVMKG